VTMPESRRLKLGDGKRWLCWRGIRREAPGGMAIGITAVYLPATYAEVMDSTRRHPQRAIFESIGATFGLVVNRIEQSVTATVLGDQEASILRSDAGAPALVVTRRYISASAGLIEVSENVHPADRFTYELCLERQITSMTRRHAG
jgi:GntR family transcriptional regulator